MTTSLELSKKLAEAGLKIETEKWWVYPKVEEPILCIKIKDVFIRFDGAGDYLRSQISFMYPAPSTDELLAVLSQISISWCKTYPILVATGDHIEEDEKALPKALGKMCLYLLGNGWRYSEKEKCLVNRKEK